jgi:protein TonB
MKRIAATRKISTSVRGTALVGFSITPAGTLSGVSLLKSSGSAELDRLALDHIRRAAPFPHPPAGARTSFSVEFRGRH